MKITYANAKVEKFFTDFNKMRKKLPIEWVKQIKKHLDNLEASDNFGVFLSVGLGRPELLSGYNTQRYSLRVAANARLIVEVNSDSCEVMICDTVEIEGVCDYHGSKENWYIP